MDQEKKEMFLYKTLDRINFWIGNVDAKISFLLSLSGVILGFIFSSNSIEKTVKNYIKMIIEDWKIILAIINIVLLFLSIFFIVKAILHFLNALKGRINPEVYKQPSLETESLLFWGSISKLGSYEEFNEKMTHATDQKMINDLQSQVYINSIITTKKFELYNKGIKSLSIGFIFLVVFKIITYVSM
jgi:hypothetical protein